MLVLGAPIAQFLGLVERAIVESVSVPGDYPREWLDS
jgi:hypothetical protein